ncbi:MAG: hypothetical protein ACI9JN_000592 [Bacteroidia bacterium]|jgi:hypothetical protein
MTGFGQTKMKTKWMPYAGISQVEPFGQKALMVWNFPNIYYDKWDALPASEFELLEVGSKMFPNPPKLKYLIEFGIYRWVNQNGRLHIGFNMFNVVLQTDDLSRLRYSDMIEGSRGFVGGSKHGPGNAEVTYNNLSFEPSYFIQQDIKKHNLAHRFGVGLNINIVLRSQYHIFSDVYVDQLLDTEHIYYYTNSDLSIHDKAWSLFPTFYYEFRVWQVKYGEIWLTLSGSNGITLVPYKRRLKGPQWISTTTANNTIATMNFGIKFNFNRN